MKKNNYIIKIVLVNGDEVHSRVEDAKNQEEALKRIQGTDIFENEKIKRIDINIDYTQPAKDDFSIYKKNGKTYIEHLSYPKFVGEITFGKESDIENVEVYEDVDDISAMDMATAMRMAEDYMFQKNKDSE